MLSVGKIGKTNLGYYHLSELARYGGNAQWMGKGAARLGLIGQAVILEVVRNVLRGFDSTGQKPLVQNAGYFRRSWSRMPGFDLVFSAPKSLSYIWATASPELRARIEHELREAVMATIARIEERAFIRTGHGGKDHRPCGLVVLLVMHFTARPVEGKRPDPQLHIHAIIVNTGVTEDGKTAALHGVTFLNKSKSEQFSLTFGVSFRHEFARGVEALGFGIEPTLINGLEGWEVAGVPDLEIRRNSKRAKQIQQAAKEKGTSARRQVIRTRQAKHEIEPGELFETWQREARERGITPAIVENLRTQHHEQELKRERELQRQHELEKGREGPEHEFDR